MLSIFRLTIKEQILAFSVMIFCFFLVIFGIFYWDIMAIEKKLNTIEQFNNILLDALEIRRYEKDILLKVGEHNLDKLTKYISKLKQDVQKMEKDILQISDENSYADFIHYLNQYERLFKTYKKTKKLNPVQVRKYGQLIVNYCHTLLDKVETKIHKELKQILWTFVIIPSTLGLIMIIFIQFQIRPVIDRLKVLEKATKDLLEDKFEPIEDDSTIQDEISDLIRAFNKMAQELNMRNEEILQTKKMAAIGTFSSGIAHEINNPLNNISLSAELLYEEYEELSPDEAKEIIKDILEQTERASKIVKNLLDFSREKEPSIKPLRICKVIEKTRKLIDNELMIKQIYFGVDIPKNLPPILGDEDKLQQVFLNLFLNSIQAMDEGGIIYVDAREQPKGYIRIDISDSGSGIPEEMLDKIFDPFFTTKEVGKGTGLGLSIVYGIIRKHGGHIEVKSRVGEGTTFSIFLPIYQPDKDRVKNNESGSD